MSPTKPEAEARGVIDKLLAAAGWHVVDRDQVNIHAACGVVVREFSLKPGHGEADTTEDGYAILTTDANTLAAAHVHNRMPEILNDRDCAVCFNPADSDAARLASLLVPHGRDDLDAYPVSTYVNSPQHDGWQYLEPLTQ